MQDHPRRKQLDELLHGVLSAESKASEKSANYLISPFLHPYHRQVVEEGISPPRPPRADIPPFNFEDEGGDGGGGGGPADEEEEAQDNLPPPPLLPGPAPAPAPALALVPNPATLLEKILNFDWKFFDCHLSIYTPIQQFTQDCRVVPPRYILNLIPITLPQIFPLLIDVTFRITLLRHAYTLTPEDLEVMFDTLLSDVLGQHNFEEVFCNITVAGEIARLKAGGRTAKYITQKVLEACEKMCQEAMCFAVFNEKIPRELLNWFLNNQLTFPFWSKVLASDTLKKIDDYRVTGVEYLPWLCVAMEHLRTLEDRGFGDSLTIPRQAFDLVELWLIRHKEIIEWLLGFILNESYNSTKRKFLYIQGAPNAGKSFFVNLLVLPPKQRKYYMTTGHFNPLAKGTYQAHALIFDDPGKLDGKANSNNKMDPTVLLHLARTVAGADVMFSVKHGWAKFTRGEVILTSNYSVAQLITPELVKAFESRVLAVELTRLPIRVKVCTLNLTEDELRPPDAAAMIDEDEPVPLDMEPLDTESVATEQGPGQDEEFKIECDDEILLAKDAAEVVVDSEDHAYYVLWRCILRLIQRWCYSNPSKVEVLLKSRALVKFLKATPGRQHPDSLYYRLAKTELADLKKRIE